MPFFFAFWTVDLGDGRNQHGLLFALKQHGMVLIGWWPFLIFKSYAVAEIPRWVFG